ncbi:MAG: hypothetical protein IJU13_01340 [Bacteroidales bacterium]|nr:hypothetical protein [Bacteroidales bacterium]
MKKSLLAALSAILCLGQACQREEIPVEPSAVEFRYTFALDESAKSTLQGHRVVWENGDRVGVYAVSGSHVSANRPGTVTLGTPCTFTVSASMALSSGDYVYAYAPYAGTAGDRPESVTLTIPAGQAQDGTVFDAASLPLVSIPMRLSEALPADTDYPVSTLSFANVASLVCYNIYSSLSDYVGEQILQVRFDGPAGICGSGTLDLTAVVEGNDATFAPSGCTGTSVVTQVSGSLPVTAARASASAVLMGLVPGTWGGTITVVTDKSDYVFTLASSVPFGRSALQPISLDLAHAGSVLPDSEVGFAEVRSKAETASTLLTNALFGSRAYIEALVIGDADNANMDQNLQYGTTVEGYAVTAIDTTTAGLSPLAPTANTIYTTENDRTNYVESTDGSYGFRLKFGAPAFNTLHKGELVRIWLDGVRLIKEPDPERYTLCQPSRIEVLATSRDLPVKARTIATLTDQDVYTRVTLSDVEFQIKRGCYANVREYDAISNPVNTDLPVATNQARRSKDGAANLLYDKDGKGIYMLMNMNCDWRWNASDKLRKQVPQGVGSFSGILVHQELERWGGNLGRYCIRPFDESDIAVAQSSASSWNTLVEWTFNLKTWSIGKYCWNAATSAGGYNTSGKYTDAQLNQERLNATEATGMINHTGATAQLYTENLKMFQGQTSSSLTQYPVQPLWGYRGFDVSDCLTSALTNNADQKFGMSAGSVIEFICNPAGFYEWDSSGEWTGDVNGIVAEFSTLGISGSAMSVSFSMIGGRMLRDNSNGISWTNAHSFPIDWAVEYAYSEDGSVWSSWTRAVNAATGITDFETRIAPFAVSSVESYPSFHSTSTVKPFYTNSDNAFGLIPYRFELPASLLGRNKVRVRWVPTTLRMAAWNPDSPGWNKGLDYRNEVVTETFEGTTPQNTAINLEDVMIQYK